METIARDLWELSLNIVGGNEHPLSVHTVVSDDDLLYEILVRLPVVSLVLFKSVSKRWLSLIKEATFVKRRSRIPKIDPPSGFFIERDWNTNVYGLVPLDIRTPFQLENTFKTEACSSNAIVMQSCNGLFLCCVFEPDKFWVYNPTVNLFKMLPEPHCYDSEVFNFTSMDFDPTKSPHYKIVRVTSIGHDNRFRIQTYSSETGIWSIVCSCSDPLPIPSSDYFGDGIFWNDDIHWISGDYDGYSYYKLDFVNKNVLTNIQLPVTMDYDCKMFESRGYLLLLGMDKNQPQDQLNIYAMRNGHPEWTYKYFVNDRGISSYGACCIQRVLCIALGEREEDSFMVIKLVERLFYTCSCNDAKNFSRAS